MRVPDFTEATVVLRQTKAIIMSATEPTDTAVLWFDITRGQLYFYNVPTSTWMNKIEKLMENPDGSLTENPDGSQAYNFS